LPSEVFPTTGWGEKKTRKRRRLFGDREPQTTIVPGKRGMQEFHKEKNSLAVNVNRGARPWKWTGRRRGNLKIVLWVGAAWPLEMTKWDPQGLRGGKEGWRTQMGVKKSP